MFSSLRSCFFSGLSLVALIGARSADVVEPAPEFPENPGTISLEAATRGFPLELNRSNRATRTKYTSIADDGTALFMHAQIYSEYVQATEGASGRAELPDVVDDIYDEFADEIRLFDETYIVVDLQRWDREWLVDWTGLERDIPENRADSLTFGDERRRDDYWVDVQERLEEIAEDHAPDGIIIGAEMNRYFDQATADWGSFIEFYWTMYDAIKAVDSNIRVSVGLNWSYFAESQIGRFLEGTEVSTDVLPFRRAYATIIDPLLVRYDANGGVIGGSDFAAFSAIPDSSLYGGSVAGVPEQHFAGIRDALPTGSGMPVVWFALGWPVAGAGSSATADWLRFFLQNAGGHNLERVVWHGFSDLLPGDCTPLTSDDIGADDSVCFRGMYAASGASTTMLNLFLE